VISKEKRSQIRRSIAQRARIESAEGVLAGECTMIDVSAGGARLVLATSDPLPSRFFLILSHGGALRRLCQPVWQTDTKAGVQFILK
jgi:hypothetical protein